MRTNESGDVTGQSVTSTDRPGFASRRNSGASGMLSVILAGLLAASAAVPASGQTKSGDLAAATLEELMNIEITSASRKEQRAADVAASIYVITQGEIEHSGIRTVPELLRLVPGVQVAQINSNKWAISVRGFNDLYSNKLLVLVDGRTVYNRLFSGVLWDTEDMMIDDIDRIEVIRGPGAAAWGANAVNGVINIITKAASESKGALVRVGGGTFESAQVAARYGGSLGSADYRVYAQFSDHNGSLVGPQVPAGDGWHTLTSGFRTDWAAAPDAFTLEGNLTTGSAHALWFNLDPATANITRTASSPSDSEGGTLLGRWTHTRSSGASLEVQSFIDLAHRLEPVGDYHRRAADVDMHFHTSLGARHDLVAGAGYRFIDESFAGGVGYALTPSQADETLVTAFAQDDVTLAADRLRVTLGTKMEHETGAGLGLQPTARAIWDLVPKRQRVWAAVSRALRTPALQERGIQVTYPAVIGPAGIPVIVSVHGNRAFRSEELISTEAGYRADFGSVASVDVAGFVGRYDGLRTTEPSTPSLQFGPAGPQVLVSSRFANLLAAETTGIEVTGHWMPARTWRLDAGYSTFHLVPHLDPASRDPTAAAYTGNAPRQQWQAHSGVSIAPRVQVDARLFHVGAIAVPGVPAYTRADARVEWRVTRELSAAAVGQNLFNRAHAEYASSGLNLISTLVPRSLGVQLVWKH